MLIKNLTIVTQNTSRDIIPHGFLRIKDTLLDEIGPALPKNTETEDVIDGAGYIVLPSFINAHVHLGETIYAYTVDGWHDLDTYIERTNQACLLSERIERNRKVITDYSALQILKGGTTTIAGGRTNESAEHIGMHNVSAYMLMLGPKLGRFGDDIVTQFDTFKKGMNPHFSRPAIFIHSLGTVSETMLKEAQRLKSRDRDLIVMAHVGETAKVEARAKNQFDLSSVEALARYDLLDAKTLLIHGNHLSPRDKTLIKQSAASVVHCLSSNLSTADKVADVADLMRLNIPVCIATDGMATSGTFSVLSEARNCRAYHNDRAGSELLTAQKALDMITLDPAQALGLSAERGSIVPRKNADLIFFKKEKQFTYETPSDILLNLPEQPDHVMVGGKWLIRDKNVLSLDEQRIEMDFARTVEAVRRDLTDFTTLE